MSWHFKLTRRLRLFLETVLVLIMLMVGAAGWGIWHLSQGPMDLKPLLPPITRVFNSWVPGITFSIQDASLEWGGQQAPLVLRVKQVGMISPRGRQIGTVAEMALGLAPKSLLFGHVAPTTLDIVSPSITVTRFPDGHIGLRFARDDANKDTADTSLNAEDILKLLEGEHYELTAFLQRIKISDITISYRDFLTQQNSISQKGHLLIERAADNTLRGQGQFEIPVGNELKLVSIDVHPERERDINVATLRLPSLTHTDLQAMMPKQDLLTHFVGVLDTELNIGIDMDLQIRFIEAAGRTDQSQIIMPQQFEEPLAIKTAQFTLRYDIDQKTASLIDTHVVLPHTALSVNAKIKNPLDETTPLAITAQAELRDTQMDYLHLYWPTGLAHNARNWVTKHIKVGVANKAIADVKLSAPAGALQKGETDKIVLDDLDGSIDFTNLTTDYLPPMLPVDHIDGKAVFDQHIFTISPTSGQLRDTHVKGGTIKISPLQAHDTNLDLTLSLDGPLKDALVLLAGKPLEFTQRVGIDPNLVSGQAETTLHLAFPLENDLKLEQLEVKAAAILNNITVQKAYRDAVLRGSNLNLGVTGEGLTLHGKATLSGAPLESLNWDEYFGSDPKIRRQFAIKGQVTPQLLKDLHLDAGNYFKNYAAIDTKIVEQQNRDTTIELSADLTQAAISIPELNTEKPTGQNGTLKMAVLAKAGGGSEIKNLDVTSPALTLKNANLSFDRQSQLQSITIPELKTGKTNISVSAKTLVRNKGWDASIKGTTLDASGFWGGDGRHDPAKQTTRPPIKLNLAVNTLILDTQYPLTKVIGHFFIDNDIILQADMDATANQATPIRLRFAPQKDGNRVLSMTSPNAGDALRALGITDSVQGGTLAINGGSDASMPQQIRGHLIMDNFTMVKAPLLARLLNAFSLGGLLDLLNQKGLKFGRMESDFTHQDKQIILKKGKMAGASLGLNFSGTINQKTDTLDLGGTIVPVQGINKLVSSIPLVGQILTGLKGEGLVAATYRITGSTKEPKVSVNPLSVLTPGILRSIFFEKID